MACARVALDQCGINVEKYYASEIDKYAIQIAKANYPDIIHIGDVREVTGEVYQDIDLLCGGSPCQGFSFAGKQLNFEDPRSALFFEFVRVLKEVKPKYFLLENVRMKKEFQDVITEYLGVEPIMINSALVSAQNRVRLYWTNIPNIEQPTDKGLVLKDILDTLTASNKEQYIETYDTPRQVATATDINGHDIIKRVYSKDGKSPALTTMQGGHRQPKVSLTTVLKDNVVTRDLHYRKLTPLECERLQTLPDNYTDGVSNTQRYKMIGNGWTVEVIKHIFNNLK